MHSWHTFFLIFFYFFCCCCSVAQLCLTLCDTMDCSMQARLPCLSLSPRVCSNSCSLNWSCHPTISSSVAPFSSCPQSLPASGSFPMSWLCIRWPKYWSFSFSISPSNEYSGLISFRAHWFDHLSVQETLQSLLQRHSSKASIFGVQPFNGPTVTSVHRVAQAWPKGLGIHSHQAFEWMDHVHFSEINWTSDTRLWFSSYISK